ncbi:flagellar hook-associated protein FlgK [Halomonas sp.]|uniref:flagellar hook-associated protein FlgK n=1 Tax=Halomonas sp. TaxID=1486246 RepID=UPI00298E016B|nr:flagellar hook-associated protein FlgK [Halomonas sp.]MDW7745247.1 flagellar hook-associated protein FlgK [Halomonas sp.]
MSIFSTGLSGLNAAQSALNSTSNNISNVYTPGYNREVTQLGEGRAGGGVQVNDIQRQFNQYVASQLNAATSKSSALESYNQQVEQIDSLLADRDAGLAPLMQNFFSAMEDLASAPSDPAARQGVLGAADTLTAQFRSFDGYLQDMQEGINGQIADEVTQVNNATEQLADINREIALARARSGEAPNSLLNQRDHMVHELNERMDIRLNIQDGKTYNISLPNGQPLVAGTQHYSLEAMKAPNDPERTVLGYRDSNNDLVALDEDTLTGGTLGGLMDFRSETLDKTQNQIGQLAVSFAGELNAQHALGADLDGEQGGDLFRIGEPQVYSYAGNADPGATATASFDEAQLNKLRATDYEVRLTATPPGEGDFEVVRKGSGEVVDTTFDNDTNTLSFGGINLEFTNLSGAQAGDRFEVQPLRRAAAEMKTAIDDLDKIAASGNADFGTGNNVNALEMQALQDKLTVGGSASFSGAYGAMVSDVGNRTNIVQANLDAQQGLTKQLEAVQQSESGVNLDEEAANLIRYQQFYQANARVIDTGTTILDTILGLRN